LKKNKTYYHAPTGTRNYLASKIKRIEQSTKNLWLSDPSNEQFEPALAWLDHLRKIYEDS